MLPKKTPRSPSPESEILGFLGEGTVVRGDLALAGAIRVDGRIEGRITSPSTLIVGPAGSLESSDLRVHTLCVAGEVRGAICVENRLEVQSGGCVAGRIVVRRKGLVVAPGGRIEGTIEMHDESDRGEPE